MSMFLSLRNMSFTKSSQIRHFSTGIFRQSWYIDCVTEYINMPLRQFIEFSWYGIQGHLRVICPILMLIITMTVNYKYLVRIFTNCSGHRNIFFDTHHHKSQKPTTSYLLVIWKWCSCLRHRKLYILVRIYTNCKWAEKYFFHTTIIPFLPPTIVKVSFSYFPPLSVQLHQIYQQV